MTLVTRPLVRCQCGHTLTIVRAEANPCDEATVVESVRCRRCRRGGHRVRDRTTDVVVARHGPALAIDGDGDADADVVSDAAGAGDGQRDGDSGGSNHGGERR